jgi:hypothetical protein
MRKVYRSLSRQGGGGPPDEVPGCLCGYINAFAFESEHFTGSPFAGSREHVSERPQRLLGSFTCYVPEKQKRRCRWTWGCPLGSPSALGVEATPERRTPPFPGSAWRLVMSGLVSCVAPRGNCKFSSSPHSLLNLCLSSWVFGWIQCRAFWIQCPCTSRTEGPLCLR